MKLTQYTLMSVAVAAGLAGVAGLSSCNSRNQSLDVQAAGVERHRTAARARYERDTQLHRMIDESRFAEARVVIDRMISHPESDFEAVEAHRVMSRLCRAQGDIDGAEASLRAAIAEWDARPAMHVPAAALRISITGDQAELAAFERDDPGRAIQLHDQVIAMGPSTHPREFRMSSQNAAMLCAQQGRYAEAARRMDDLLASAVAAKLTESERVGLLSSQASWLVSSGDLDGGCQKYMQLWNEFGSGDDESVLWAGVLIARWQPVPQDCARRMELCRELLSKLEAIRTAPSRSDTAPDDTELDEIEHSVMVVLGDSEGCPDPDGLIARARAVLGLP
jgi:hypothetical protein